MKNQPLIYTEGTPPKPGAYPVMSVHNGAKGFRYWTGERWLLNMRSISDAKWSHAEYKRYPERFRKAPHKLLVWGKPNPFYLTDKQAHERVAQLEAALRSISCIIDVRPRMDMNSKVGEAKTRYVHQILADNALGDRK